MTWCFDCHSLRNGEQLALCRDLGHDTDDDHLFTPTRYDMNDQEKSKKKKSSYFAKKILWECMKEWDINK